MTTVLTMLFYLFTESSLRVNGSFAGIFRCILPIFYIIGLWRLFVKCRIPGWYALIPCAREYMLAKSAGREPEGRVTSVTSFFIILVNEVLFLIPADSGSALVSILTFVDFALDIVRFIYHVRIYSGLIEVYGAKRGWMPCWILFRSFVAFYWGLSGKFTPHWYAEDIKQNILADLSGGTDQLSGDGLSVELKERTVTEFFQKKYLLRNINLYIKPGHMVLLLGGSGAGKTTFINAVNGYEKASARVLLDGNNMYSEYRKMKYQVGFVPQQELMRGKDTVLNTLNDAALLRLPFDISAADRKAREEEVLNTFGLSNAKNNLVEKLSGGQKKRLSIAMEYISNPSLFILDEPDSGLDGVMARELMENLRRIADQGKIVIVITHTPDRVADLFDDVIVLARDSHKTGRLAFFGPLDGARSFFGCETMEQIVLKINSKSEGGEGLADEYITKYGEVQNG